MTQQFVIIKMLNPQFAFVNTFLYTNAFFEGFVAYLCFKISGEYTSSFISCQYESFLVNLAIIIALTYSKRFRNIFSGFEILQGHIIGKTEVFLFNLAISIKSCVLFVSAFFNIYSSNSNIPSRSWNNFFQSVIYRFTL